MSDDEMSLTETQLVRNQGVTAPLGFKAAGYTAGIKASGKSDLAIVLNEGPMKSAAAVFTTNKVKAAPVLWTQEVIKDGSLRAVILNSGNANACTGAVGFQDVHATAETVAAALSDWGTETGAYEIAVASTGLIGDRLPIEKVLAGAAAIVGEIAGGITGGTDAAHAIMTTDTVCKQAALHHKDKWNVGGMGKGAAMLAPSLATMLVVLTTDIVATPEQLSTALQAATTKTFDRLDVDGVTSTNDTVLLLASGASEISPAQDEIDAAVLAVCGDLALQMQADAEGVTKRIAITVSGAASEEEAVSGARVVARDSLVKTALFGSDPNWGRVVCAIGNAPIQLDPNVINVFFNDQPVCLNGMGAPGAREVNLAAVDIALRIELGQGNSSATILTTDLSDKYVEENSAYST